LYELEDEVAEVGRSCVHPEYLNGSVISLLWAGIGEYIQEHNIRYLMGCGSIHSTNPVVASEIYAFLKHNNALADERFSINPLPSFEVPGLDTDFPILDIKETSKKIPPLIKGYLRLGAKICGRPALDPVFKTTDVFVLFDSTQITERYLNKYLS